MLRDLMKEDDSINKLLHSIDKDIENREQQKPSHRSKQQSFRDVEAYFGKQGQEVSDLTQKEGFTLLDQSMKSFVSAIEGNN